MPLSWISGIISWLRYAGILSDARILSLKDAFVVAILVFIAGVVAMFVSKALWRRLVRAAVQRLLNRTVGRSSVPMLR
jgi:uncharacterized membrane protein YraQ (UPF0718 family)